MTTKKRICIISLALPIEVDIRTIKQIEYLAPHYDVTLIGYGDPKAIADLVAWRSINRTEGVARRLIERALVFAGKLIPALYNVWYWGRPRYQQAFAYAQASRADAFLADDWAALPIAARAAANGQPILYDADEYWVAEVESNPTWKRFFAPLIAYFLRQSAPRIAASMTVSKPIAEQYAQNFDIHPILVYNAPKPESVPARSIDPDRIRLMHHGSPVRNRRLEMLIEAMPLLDARYTLTFMLTAWDGVYMDELRALAARLAPGRIDFVPPVYPTEIVQTIAAYDIEISIIPPATFNYLMALPNKIFEAINAGMGVVVGQSPAMVDLVQEYHVGWVTADFTARALADTLNALSADDIEVARAHASASAQTLNADVELGKMLSLFERLLNPAKG
ncbi:MAG: glycosyltransferase [Chloroflexota bacterium]|nr:glycosyltransferase [Chloroflexota bacterium]